MKEMQRQCQDLITKARTEKDAKIEECEKLRSQVRSWSSCYTALKNHHKYFLIIFLLLPKLGFYTSKSGNFENEITK